MLSNCLIVFLFCLNMFITVYSVSKWDVTKPLILTPLVNKGSIKEAQNLSVTKIGNIISHAGYFTVNEKCGNNLFFWFFKAEKSWEDAPVLLWLNGGPGSSSTIGIFKENGPWDHTKSRFVNRIYHWSKKLNVVYFDQPVGTGFSFTVNGCYVQNMAEMAEEMTSALFQFFKLFPILQDNKFFLTGESYAGHYIPAIAVEIDKRNMNAINKINLIGLVIGNPILDIECLDITEYLFQTGIIDRTGYDVTKRYFNKFISALKSKNYIKANELEYKSNGGAFLDKANLPNYYNILKDRSVTFEYEQYMTEIETRKKLHVGRARYDDGNIVFQILNQIDQYVPISPSVEYLLKTNKYIVGFYGGQLDTVCLYSGIPCVLKNLKWPGVIQYINAYRLPYYVSGRLAGWFKTSGNIFEVAFRGAGHLVPADQPEAMYDLITAVVQDEPGTPLLTGLKTKP